MCFIALFCTSSYLEESVSSVVLCSFDMPIPYIYIYIYIFKSIEVCIYLCIYLCAYVIYTHRTVVII